MVPPSQRLKIRRVAGKSAAQLPGVFHITVKYGWAERPRSECELLGMLASLGDAACEPGVRSVELAALAHTPCWLRAQPGGNCVCRTARAPACLPVRIVVSRDALTAAAGASLLQRCCATVFSAVASVFGTTADLLQLSGAGVVETSPPVVLPLRRARRHGLRDSAGSGASSFFRSLGGGVLRRRQRSSQLPPIPC